MISDKEKKAQEESEELSESTADKTVITKLDAARPVDEKAYILFLSGELQGKMFGLDALETIIGRAKDSTIFINDHHISRHHFVIKLDRGKAVIEDLGSTNGTYVNGTKVERKALENGDKIQISTATIIKFAYGDEGERMFLGEFYQMANFDAVTGAYNKHAFIKRLAEELVLAERIKHPLSLLMLDIDFFKKVNDTHGHLAGDFILAKITTIVQDTIREGDLLCRYGGEEFAVLLRGVDEKGAIILAERIRKNVETAKIEFEGKKISVTVSLGVAEYGEGTDKPDALIKVADDCLYQSKENGRNKVTSKSAKS